MTFRKASRAPSGGTFKRLIYWPAQDLSPPSPLALERTARVPPFFSSVSVRPVMATSTARGSGQAMALRVSSSETRRRASRSFRSRSRMASRISLPKRDTAVLPVCFGGENESVGHRQPQLVADLAEHGGLAAGIVLGSGVHLRQPCRKAGSDQLLESRRVALNLELLSAERSRQRSVSDTGEALQGGDHLPDPGEDRRDTIAQHVPARRHVLEVFLKPRHQLQATRC